MQVESIMWRFRINKRKSETNSNKKDDRRLKFVSGKFTEASAVIKNPAQGWYSIYPFKMEEEINPEELKWCLKEEESVALVLLDLSAYQKIPLDFFAKKNITDILRFFKKYHKDVILRPVYDQNGNGMKKEPETLDLILEHIRQICEILRNQSHTVFLFQGFLIGSWGEMHSSRYLSEENLKTLYHCIRENLEEEIYLAVRTPAIWRKLTRKEVWQNGKFENLALFNDALFASDTDLGTYGTMTQEAAGWKNSWNRQEELGFETTITGETPFGGEVILGEKRPLFVLLREMRQLHLTYLNSNHDFKALEHWKKEAWCQPDVFQGKSFYEYAGAHMGYRFVVRNVTAEYRMWTRNWKLEIEIENRGFGKCFQNTEIVICMENEKENREIILDADLREWRSGEVKTVFCSLPSVRADFYIQARRKSDQEPVYFANKSSGRLWIGRLS